MNIDATNLHFKELNERIKNSKDMSLTIKNCLGQRYIGSGQSGRNISIEGTPGNALGSYLDGSIITVFGNAQDATGDTMNDGLITIHGSCGDATGYAMRGGKIFVKGNAGYRAGIHMKAYKEQCPVLVIGGSAGSFLGEYQAGGIIIVLGIGCNSVPVDYYCATGMHGGKIFIRSNDLPSDLPKQVVTKKASKYDLDHIRGYIEEFCNAFLVDIDDIINDNFYELTSDTKNPYHQLYTNI
jgi:glutamate synthase domain-containing protein 3